MPVLNLQAAAPPNQAGTQSPAYALMRYGPCVQALVGVAQVIARQLQQQGRAVPRPSSGLALIDTGAAHTCIDEGIAIALGLPVINVVNVMSATHASTQRSIYPAQIELLGLPFAISAPTVIGAPLAEQGLIALLGRDVLLQATLFYNGPAGTISFSV